MKERLKNRLIQAGLKITPQRMAVLEAVSELEGHPSTDKIIAFIKEKHPNIASGTVYKTLETFVLHGIIKKIKTDKDILRYDAILDKHHHLYCEESDRVKDYYDEELTELLNNYFSNKNIPDFTVTDIKLQLTGKFKSK